LAGRIKNCRSESVRLCVVKEAVKEVYKTMTGGRERQGRRKKKATTEEQRKRKEKKMEKKYIALLLVCLVVAAGVGVEAEEYTPLQKDCFSHCWHGCFFPTAFCNEWCAAMCKYPINIGN